MLHVFRIGTFVALTLVLTGCFEMAPPAPLEYQEEYLPYDAAAGPAKPCTHPDSLNKLQEVHDNIFAKSNKCLGCHVQNASGGLSLDGRNGDMAWVCESLYSRVDFDIPDNSLLFAKAFNGNASHAGGTPLSVSEVEAIKEWIELEKELVNAQPELPNVNLLSSSVTVGEGTAVASVDVELSKAFSAAVTVFVTLETDGATLDEDFVFVQNSVLIPAGQTSATISLLIIDDETTESEEKLKLTLSNAVNANLGTDLIAEFIIIDNDGSNDIILPQIDIAEAPEVSISEDAGTVELAVNLNTASTNTVAVTYSFINTNSAANGSDINFTNGSLSFSPGETTKNISFTVIDDQEIEALESFGIVLSGPINATLGADEIVVKITDNDVPSADLAKLCQTEGLEKFSNEVKPILQNCTSCHGVNNALHLDDSSDSLFCTKASTRVDLEEPSNSMLIKMPKDGAFEAKVHAVSNYISQDEANIIAEWVAIGKAAVTPDSLCEEKQLAYFNQYVKGVFTSCSGCHGNNNVLKLNIADGTDQCKAVLGHVNVVEPSDSLLIQLPLNGSFNGKNHSGGAGKLNAAQANYIKEWVAGAEYTPPAAKPQITFAAPSYSISEDGGSVKIQLNSSIELDANIILKVSAGGGNALATLDYVLSQTQVTLEKNTKTVEFEVAIVNDTDVENNETFEVSLVADNAYSIGAANKTTVTIVNDDQAGQDSDKLEGLNVAASIEGSYSVAGGIHTVKGAGKDIWGESDEFYFAHTKHEKDSIILGKIENLSNTHMYAKGGLMLRSSLNANASFMMIQMIPQNNEIKVQWRSTDGGANDLKVASDQSHRWFKVERNDNEFSAYTSADGNIWIHQLSLYINMGDDVYAGIAHTSADEGQLGEVTFSNLLVKDKAENELALAVQNIGSPAIEGEYIHNVETGTHQLKGPGLDIFGTRDEFLYAYQYVSGDGEIVAKLDSITNNHTYAKMGIMIRDSLDDTAANGYVVLTADDGLRFHWRPSNGVPTEYELAPAGQQAHRFVKLKKVDNMLEAFTSVDGNNWTSFKTQEINFSGDVVFGLASTGHMEDQLGDSTYSNVSIIDESLNNELLACSDMGVLAKFVDFKTNVIDGKCMGCHSGQGASGGLDLGGDVVSICKNLAANNRMNFEIPGESLVINKAGYAQPSHGGGALLNTTEIDYLTELVSDEAKIRGFDPKPPRPFITFNVASQQVNESQTNVSVIVSLSAIYPEAVSAELDRGESSTHANDYSLASDSVSIAAGQLQTTLAITINNDEFDENDEVLALRLKNPVNGKLGSIPLHQITIKDDDEGKVIETQNWIGKDIGNPPTAGEHTINGGTITVKGSGNDIWGTDDQFYYLFKAMKGDGALVAKIDSLEVSTPYAKAGVMIRESLASSSKYSFVVRTAENGLRHHWKQLPSSTPQDDFADNARQGDQYIKVERVGDAFNAYSSANGINWTLISSTTIEMNEELYIGLVNCSQLDTVGNAIYSGVKEQFDQSNLTDNDKDAIPDLIDEDDDNDGVADLLDKFPNDPGESADYDGDGIGDVADLDDDNDGYPDVTDPAPNNGFVPAPPDGEALWLGNCSGCHESKDKHGRDFDTIKSSFNTVADMAGLKNKFTDAEVRALETYLNSYRSIGGGDGEMKIRVPLGGSRYLVSKFQGIFVNPSMNGDDREILDVVKKNIEHRKGIFGEPCTPNDIDCLVACTEAELQWSINRDGTSLNYCDRGHLGVKPSYYFYNTDSAEDSYARMINNMTADSRAMPNATRKGFLIQTCEAVLNYDRAVQNALALAGVGVNDMPTNENVEALMEIFMPAIPVTDAERDALKAIYIDAQSKGMNNIGTWRMVMTPLCKSETFELI
jgi:cytochrome c553/regulation of enolase protein 1 (concanavalin A-like superfamily)